MVSLEFELWREAAKHIELAELVARIHRVLRERVGSESLVLTRYVGVGRFDTRAAAGRHAVHALARPRTDPSGPELEAGLVSIGRGKMIAVLDPNDALLPLAPRGATLPCIAMPLMDARKLTGIAWFGVPRDKDIAAIVRRLEPTVDVFATVLAREAHLGEMTKRRRAAEAEAETLRMYGADSGADGIPKDVLKRLARVSATDVPVLVRDGSREITSAIARVLHAKSRRAKGPFVTVDCEAESLQPSAKHATRKDEELREHAAERADGGTLFLRGIHGLSPSEQSTLLRVLDDGVLDRAGGKRHIPIDVRLVVATEVDLEARVAEGAFREDLFYRIGVVSVRLANAEATGEPGRKTPADAQESLPPAPRSSAPPKRVQSSAPPATTLQLQPSASAIEQALAKALGRIEGPFGAATALGMNPHTLRSQMRKLGIDWRTFR